MRSGRGSGPRRRRGRKAEEGRAETGAAGQASPYGPPSGAGAQGENTGPFDPLSEDPPYHRPYVTAGQEGEPARLDAAETATGPHGIPRGSGYAESAYLMPDRAHGSGDVLAGYGARDPGTAERPYGGQDGPHTSRETAYPGLTPEPYGGAYPRAADTAAANAPTIAAASPYQRTQDAPPPGPRTTGDQAGTLPEGTQIIDTGPHPGIGPGPVLGDQAGTRITDTGPHPGVGPDRAGGDQAGTRIIDTGPHPGVGPDRAGGAEETRTGFLGSGWRGGPDPDDDEPPARRRTGRVILAAAAAVVLAVAGFWLVSGSGTPDCAAGDVRCASGSSPAASTTEPDADAEGAGDTGETEEPGDGEDEAGVDESAEPTPSPTRTARPTAAPQQSARPTAPARDRAGSGPTGRPSRDPRPGDEAADEDEPSLTETDPIDDAQAESPPADEEEDLQPPQPAEGDEPLRDAGESGGRGGGGGPFGSGF